MVPSQSVETKAIIGYLIKWQDFTNNLQLNTSAKL